MDEKDGNDDDGVIAQAEKKRVKRRNSPDKGDRENGSESEEERLRDQREKEQLEQNIRKRDAVATRKVAKKNLRRKEEEEAVRKTSADIEGLRRASRQQYLKKRVQKKLDEIRDDIEDEDYLFKLTEAEYRELGIKKQILGLVKF